ncbi:hypothetical protein BVY04_02570 [bacterium M21]|nr:hypothetical protein BVY04_02570 [bacterium M21]
MTNKQDTSATKQTYNTRLTLLDRIRNKDDQASWEEFVNIYKQYLYTVIRNLNVNHHDTEEILQTVFLKIWKKFEDFSYNSARGKFRFWLCSVARNSVIDFIRSQQSRMDQLDKIQSGEREFYLKSITIPEVDEIAENEWRNYLANLALSNIQKTQKEHVIKSFTLFVQGESISEIAKELNLAENTVYVYKSKVLELLKQETKRLMDDLD